MSDRHVTLKNAVMERQALYLKEQPTTLRRCLGCDEWMHSTGPDHRLCNPCKCEPDFTTSKVGARATVGHRKRGRPDEDW
jgi:hypothetical protein